MVIESEKRPPPPVKDLPPLMEWDLPMTKLQAHEAHEAWKCLGRHFQGKIVDVSIEESICYDKHDLRRAVKPDVLVALGVPPRLRSKYLPWKELAPPSWVLEVASESTHEVDAKEKPPIYHDLHVQEMVLFDPEGLYHEEILQVFRWTPDGYESVPSVAGRFPSPVLGLELAAERYVQDATYYWRLRFYLPGAPIPLPTTEELIAENARALAENARALAEKDATIEDLRRQLRELS